eukprot:1159068-Pelagomonas_calceolata.AAC.6
MGVHDTELDLQDCGNGVQKGQQCASSSCKDNQTSSFIEHLGQKNINTLSLFGFDKWGKPTSPSRTLVAEALQMSGQPSSS